MRATYVGAGVSSIPCGITTSSLQRNDGRWASVQNCKRFGEIDVYATRRHQETLPTDDPKGERHDVGSFGTDAMAFHAHLGTARSAVMRALKSEFDALGSRSAHKCVRRSRLWPASVLRPGYPRDRATRSVLANAIAVVRATCLMIRPRVEGGVYAASGLEGYSARDVFSVPMRGCV